MHDHLVDDLSELMHSTLVKHFLHLLHVVTDDNMMDDVLELLHWTLLEQAPAQGN
jgi:hypothetical protein